MDQIQILKRAQHFIQLDKTRPLLRQDAIERRERDAREAKPLYDPDKASKWDPVEALEEARKCRRSVR